MNGETKLLEQSLELLRKKLQLLGQHMDLLNKVAGELELKLATVTRLEGLSPPLPRSAPTEHEVMSELGGIAELLENGDVERDVVVNDVNLFMGVVMSACLGMWLMLHLHEQKIK